MDMAKETTTLIGNYLLQAAIGQMSSIFLLMDFRVNIFLSHSNYLECNLIMKVINIYILSFKF